MNRRHNLKTRLLAGAVLCSLALAGPAMAAGGDAPDWNPKVSEKLIKLPASVLSRQIDRDFLNSSLGEALRSQENDIRYKIQTLADIKEAMELADEDQELELEHKLIVEKQAYIQMAVQKNAIQKQQLTTKMRTLERILTRLGQEKGFMTEDRKTLIESQKAARERFAKAVAQADDMIGSNPLAAESKYFQEYEGKIAALNALREKIAQHEMNQGPVIDGTEVSKVDYVRHMVALTEGELALIAMEEEMLGYMARLVGLDALALAEKQADWEVGDDVIVEARGTSPDAALSAFLD